MLTAAGTLNPRKAFGAPVLRNLMDITFYLGFVVVYAVMLARAASPCPNIIFIFTLDFLNDCSRWWKMTPPPMAR